MKNKRYIIVLITALIILLVGILAFNAKNKTYTDYINKANEEEPLKDDTLIEEEKNLEEDNVLLKDNSIGIPILYYHSVFEDSKKDEVVIDTEKFREQMKYLKDNNYKTLTLDETYNYIKNNEKVPEKSVVITFDDGWIDNYDNAFPILKEFNFKATIFVITDLVDAHHLYLKSDQIKEMSDYGIEFGSHTLNHDNLLDISKEKRKKTLEESKVFLEKITQKPVISIAYPFGVYDQSVLKATNDLGYKLGFTTNKGWVNNKSELLELERVYVNGNAPMEVFKERISNPNYK